MSSHRDKLELSKPPENEPDRGPARGIGPELGPELGPEIQSSCFDSAQCFDEDTQMGSVATGSAHPLSQHQSSHVVPEKVGPWRIRNLLGRGGMGEVWRAERADGMFEMSVAVKIMRNDRREVMDRFNLERRVLAQLDHSGIARLLDGGVTEAGLPYLVTEFIEGESIDRWCEHRAANLEQRLSLFLDVCDAVDYAHSELVVHRDLKPGNILIDAEGGAKLLDFGIAKLVQSQALDEATDESPHTPEYAAPEQVQGGAITVRTDVYALGLLLYLLLTGIRPQARSGALAEQVERILHRVPDAPSQVLNSAPKSTQRLIQSQQLRGNLDAIVVKAIEKNPLDRYSSVSALANDIRAHLQNKPILARRWGRFEHVRAYLKRNASLTSIITIAVTASLFFGGLALYQAGNARATRAALEVQALQASNREQETLAARVFISSLLKDLNVQGGAGPKLVAQAQKYAETSLSDFPELQAGVMWEIASAYSNFKMFDMRLRMLQANYDRIKESHRELSADPKTNPALLEQIRGAQAVAGCQLATGFSETDQRARTHELMEESDQLIAGLPPALQNGWVMFDCMRIGGRALRFTGNYEEAEARVARGLHEMRTRYTINGEPIHSQFPDVLNGYAVAQMQAGHFKNAEATLSELIALLNRQGRQESNQMANALTNMAATKRALGRLGESRLLYEQTLALQILRSEKLISPITLCGWLQTEIELGAGRAKVLELVSRCEKQIEGDVGTPFLNARICWQALMQAARHLEDQDLASRAVERMSFYSQALSLKEQDRDVPTLAFRLEELQMRKLVTLASLQRFLAIDTHSTPSMLLVKSMSLRLASELYIRSGDQGEYRRTLDALRELWRTEIGARADVFDHPVFEGIKPSGSPL